MIYRRQKQQYAFAGLLGVIALINVLFFFILHRPARAEYVQLQESITRLRAELVGREKAVKDLELTNTQLGRFEHDRRELYTKHFISWEAGFGHVLPLLDELAERAGVRKSRVTYAPEGEPQYGLSLIKIDIPVQGEYDNVVNFIRELEESETFFIINSIGVASAGDGRTGDGGGMLSLSLTLETFFYR